MICLRHILIFLAPIHLAKELFETKDKKKHSELVEEVKNRWSNLKNEIKKMSKEEIKNVKTKLHIRKHQQDS